MFLLNRMRLSGISASAQVIARLGILINENEKFLEAEVEIGVDGPIITMLYLGCSVDERLSSCDEPFHLRELDDIMEKVRSTPWVPYRPSPSTTRLQNTPHHFWVGYRGASASDATPLTIPGLDSYERPRSDRLHSFVQDVDCSRDWINNPMS